MNHIHTPVEQKTKTECYSGSVAGPEENPRAHGGVTLTHFCVCGATQKKNVNGQHAELGEWRIPDGHVAAGKLGLKYHHAVRVTDWAGEMVVELRWRAGETVGLERADGERLIVTSASRALREDHDQFWDAWTRRCEVVEVAQ